MWNLNTGRYVPCSKTWFHAALLARYCLWCQGCKSWTSRFIYWPGTGGVSRLRAPSLSAYSVTAVLRTPVCTKRRDFSVALTGELFLTAITDKKRWRDCYNVASVVWVFFFLKRVRFLYLLIESQYTGQETAVSLTGGLVTSVPLTQRRSLTHKASGDCEASKAGAGFGEEVLLSLCGQLYTFLITSSRIHAWVVIQALGHSYLE